MTSRPQPIENVPPDLQPIMEMARASMGFVPNSFLTMARRPALLQALMPMMGYLVGPGLSIGADLRQMVAYMASYGAGCSYCQAHTSHGAEKNGVAAGKIENLWRYEESDLFTAAEKAALGFAFASGQVPNAVTESHYAALRDHYSEDQILDLAAVVSIFGFLNRWNDTVGTPLEQKPTDFAGSSLTDSGWEPGKHG
ncbi:carboxymuconolactone decarboxylase family protein [Parasphingorhabdus sp.]|uniref:carboxymuconolactone decarboxylase family protein n=1 Tax=Parasphingorhabdus sp. TaxID=2709688 RepID=UPI003266BA1A